MLSEKTGKSHDDAVPASPSSPDDVSCDDDAADGGPDGLADTGVASPLPIAVARPNVTKVDADLVEATGDGPEMIDGRFRVERTLGRGGMGVVYLVWDTRLERHVALKLVKAVTGDASLYRSRLEREARALAKLSHPNVVPVFEVGEHDGELYLAMEYVQGQTLRAWAEVEPRPWPVVVGMYLQAARGLHAAHTAGLLHRDFKPDNVIVGGDERVRVLDFGLARAIVTKEPNSPAADLVADDKTLAATLTQVGAGIGTPAYMAAEQYMGEAADERTDVFAFCVSLYEALHGKRPFEGSTRFALAKAVTRGEFPAPSGAHGVPRWLDRVIVSGLHADKDDRPASVEAVIVALEAGLRRRRRRTLVGGVGLALAAAGGIGWSASNAAQVDPREPCDAFTEKVDAIWNPERKQALQGDAQGLAYATVTLDALASQWRGGAEALCDDGLAPAQYDDVRECQEAWLPSLQRSVELVENGDAATLLRAPDLLARITPPDGDYCALGPAAVVDPEVWALAERAREAATVGDAEAAIEHADSAIERATMTGGEGLTADLAEAHSAKAEALARNGDFEAADKAFAEAERHAIGGEHPQRLLSMRLLWAKVEARLQAGDRGSAHLRRAESLGVALGKTESPMFVGEVAEAAGVVAFERGEYEEAAEAHQRAESLFNGVGHPLLAARAAIGAGASLHSLGEHKTAAEAYTRATETHTHLGVPAAYRDRIQAELNLGLGCLAILSAEGFPHFEHVAAFGSDVERLQALASATNLAVNLSNAKLATMWARRALAELRRQPEAGVGPRHDVQLSAGAALFGLVGDPEAEAILEQAEATARGLPAVAQVATQQAWVAWLNYRGRCEDARARLRRLDATMELRDAEIPGYSKWRRSRQPNDCNTQIREDTQ